MDGREAGAQGDLLEFGQFTSISNFPPSLFTLLSYSKLKVVEQTYLSETAPPHRVTELTSELGTFAILGFVCGPSFGALFTSIDINLGHNLVLDAYTSPGWFILALCVAIFFLVIVYFDPEVRAPARSPSPCWGARR